LYLERDAIIEGGTDKREVKERARQKDETGWLKFLNFFKLSSFSLLGFKALSLLARLAHVVSADCIRYTLY